MKRFFFLLFVLTSLYSVSQESSVCDCPGQTKKGTFYVSWGYNRGWYSKSDIHFKNSGSDNYDFTLYGLKATDRKSDYNYFLRNQLTIPQYNYRLGYFFNKKKNLGIEINFDHTKYIMVRNQMAHLKGTIRGTYYDTDTLISTSFLCFEHTDGANFLMLNVMKRFSFYNSVNKKHWLSAVIKAGAGVVIPRTEVILFDEALDNKFHVAGYVTGTEIELRYDLFKYFFISPSIKGVFANYTDVLTVGTGRANHHFWAFETIAVAGFQFPL